MQKLHREVNALELTALDGQVARLGRAGAENDGVEVVHELLGGHVLADLAIADELNAFVFQQLDAAEDNFVLLQLHVGNAIHEQAAGAVGALEDEDAVARFVELRGSAEASGAGADDGDLLAGAVGGRLGFDPAVFPAVINNAALDILDGDGGRADAEDAGAFARRGTDAAGELGEVVRFVEAFERFLPEAAIDEVVPLGDEVVDGAAAGHAADKLAGVAEGHAAIHAAPALLAEFRLRHVVVELAPVGDARQRRAVGGKFAGEFEESSGFTHESVEESGFGVGSVVMCQVVRINRHPRARRLSSSPRTRR